MSDRNVVDLPVINLSLAVREYVSEADNVSRMRNLLRNFRSGLVETVHCLSADLQHSLQAAPHPRGIARGYSL